MRRLFDITASAIGLLILSPVFVIVAIILKLDSPGPVFHRGTRMGRGGKSFRIYKFRTMIADASRYGSITHHRDPRVTRVGRFLRKSKIDEAPQLINVLKGDMSLVGPRPEDPKYLQYYSEDQRRILSVLPGITSIASIRYRNEEELLSASNWETVYVGTILPTKLDIELNYLATRSFTQDLLILFATFFALLRDETYFDSWSNAVIRGEKFVAQYLSWIMIDVLLVLAAVVLSLSIRPLDGKIYFSMALLETAVGISVYLITNYIFGIYQRFWRYASAQESVALLSSVVTGTLLLSGLDLPVITGKMPMANIWLAGLLTLALMSGVRYRRQLFHGGVRLFSGLTGLASGRGARVLVVGAGEEGQLLVRQLQHSWNGQAYQVVGIVDPDVRKHGLLIHDAKVFGDLHKIPELAAQLHPDLIIIATQPTSTSERDELLSLCRETSAQIKVLPGLFDWLNKNGNGPGWFDLKDSDLLQREPYHIDQLATRQLIAGRTVMVTGASGSIGSELCRQIAAHNPRELVLVDINESGLHDLVVELRLQVKGLCVKLALADITNQRRMTSIFQQTRPQIVFHVAAYKHVPILEEFPEEGVRVNIMGTRALHSLSESFGVERFILISSDKAADPLNVLGMTKWLGELIVTATPPRSAMLSTAVRFGNVLGSRGSVVPTFEKQIELGGPVTITDPNMKRYFLTISEAVSLVIQATSMTQGGDLYLLDMGVPVNILHLAHRMIRQRGLRPGKDIPIEFVGTRPGEKVREELVAPDEERLTTENRSIFRIRRLTTVNPDQLEEALSLLIMLYEDGAPAETVRSELKRFVTELKASAVPSELSSLDAAGMAARPVVEKRQTARAAVGDSILVQRLGRPGSADPLVVESVNISSSGLMFESSSLFQVQEKVVIRRNSPYSKLEIHARIVHSFALKNSGYRIGVTFERFVKGDSHLIEREVERLLTIPEKEMYAYDPV